MFSVLVLPSLAATSLQVLTDSFCGYSSKLLPEGLVSLPTSVAGGGGGAAAAGQTQRLGVSSSCNVGLGCSNE